MENNQEIIENAELNMMASVNHLETELAKIRAGKANPIMLKGVSVEYYGNMTPLNQVASISTPNAQTISIQPWEKDLLDEIEKSIIGIGVNISNNIKHIPNATSLNNYLKVIPSQYELLNIICFKVESNYKLFRNFSSNFFTHYNFCQISFCIHVKYNNW